MQTNNAINTLRDCLKKFNNPKWIFPNNNDNISLNLFVISNNTKISIFLNTTYDTIVFETMTFDKNDTLNKNSLIYHETAGELIDYLNSF